ncbi:MAG TPA: hypothetical protein VD926_05145, partial [Acidimicrobiales bacterium]|nr:hypothetical protein [Acidimicrobiales bacterium]
MNGLSPHHASVDGPCSIDPGLVSNTAARTRCSTDAALPRTAMTRSLWTAHRPFLRAIHQSSIVHPSARTWKRAT